jgi:hypothetical protein
LKIGKELAEEEVETYSHNGYKYCHNSDEALIASIEMLWMIMHQKMKVSNTRMINKSFHLSEKTSRK